MNTKTLTVCSTHIFSCDIFTLSCSLDSFLGVYNLRDVCDFNDANLANYASIGADVVAKNLAPNDWNSGLFQTTFDLPKNLAMLLFGGSWLKTASSLIICSFYFSSFALSSFLTKLNEIVHQAWSGEHNKNV